jgi:hypothetical protein
VFDLNNYLLNTARKKEIIDLLLATTIDSLEWQWCQDASECHARSYSKNNDADVLVCFDIRPLLLE